MPRIDPAEQSAVIMRAFGKLSLCAASVDEANQLIPAAMPSLDNGVPADAVYFGAASVIREVAADLRDLWNQM